MPQGRCHAPTPCRGARLDIERARAYARVLDGTARKWVLAQATPAAYVSAKTSSATDGAAKGLHQAKAAQAELEVYQTDFLSNVAAVGMPDCRFVFFQVVILTFGFSLLPKPSPLFIYI